MESQVDIISFPVTNCTVIVAALIVTFSASKRDIAFCPFREFPQRPAIGDECMITLLVSGLIAISWENIYCYIGYQIILLVNHLLTY